MVYVSMLHLPSCLAYIMHSLSLQEWGGNGWDVCTFRTLVEPGVSNNLMFKLVRFISSSYLCLSVELGVAGR